MKTYRDIVFWSVVLAWSLTGILVFFVNKDNVPVVDFTMMTLMVVLIILKNTNKKFNNWLNKKI